MSIGQDSLTLSNLYQKEPLNYIVMVKDSIEHVAYYDALSLTLFFLEAFKKHYSLKTKKNLESFDVTKYNFLINS